jgi:hypothetical protein
MQQYTYEAALAASEKVNWRVEDLIGGEKRLDFTKPILPESLARVSGLDFLTDHEKLVLNQLRGHNYLYMFGLVEEFILPFVMEHVESDEPDDDVRRRAMLQFATEEAKHIHLFKMFRAEFCEDFGTDCAVIGPPEDIAAAVLAHHPLAVALVILHIEWMTQRHFTESVKDNGDLDPQFKSLLKHHWMEEAQHAKLDQLMIQAMAATLTEQEIAAAVEEYVEIGGLLDGGVRQQVIFDLESFTQATGRKLTAEEEEQVLETQHQAMRWTVLGSGISHKNVLATFEFLSPAARERLESLAGMFS